MDKSTTKPQSDHAVFTFGRMNPPTTGHKKLVDHMVSHAWKHKADPHIFLSHTQDKDKNPLPHKEKVAYAKKFFPHAHVHEGNDVKTAIDAVKHLHKKGYKKVTMMVGGDRHQEFHNLLHKYNGKEYHIPHLEVKSAGHRDPDSEGVEGMSASKMREHASKKKFSEFKKGVPNPAHAKELYHAVRKGMKLENFQKNFKALFLVGGPGSGKDFIISSLLDEANIIELPLDKLNKAIAEQSNIPELDGYHSLIVNGNADNFDKVILSKHVLESMGYDTMMVYVYTSNEESKSRNDERISRNAKTFSEEVRYEKYKNSVENMHGFLPIFENFHIFNNSFDFATVSISKRNEILGWLQELGTSVGDFFESTPLNESANLWLMENRKKNMGMNLPKVPKPVGGNDQHKPILKGYKRVKEGSFWKLVKEMGGQPGGIGGKNSAGDTDKGEPMAQQYSGKKQNGSPYMYPKGDGKKPSKKPKERGATPPPDFFDQRMGMVPSGGVGITVSHFVPDGEVIQEKSLERLRKNMAAIINNVDEEK